MPRCAGSPFQVFVPVFAAAVMGTSVLATTMLAKADEYPRTITDVNGNSVVLESASKRSAPLPPPLGVFTIAVPGDPDRLVTAHPWSKAVMMEGSLAGYFPQLAQLPTGAIGAGFVPNIEELLTYAPDLVFQVGFRGTDVTEPILAAGLPLLTINVTANDDAMQWIPMLGAAFGEETRAARILDWRVDVRERIAETVCTIAEADRPTVVHISGFDNGIRVVGGTHFRSWQIELAGGVNLGASIPQRSSEINPEQLLAWDPDVILLHAFREDLAPDAIYDDPRFETLRAVQERRVYAWPVGGDRWEAPTAESPLGWMWLSELLHPDHFDWDFETEVNTAHQLLYGHQPAPGDVARMLRVSDNEGSAGYDRFSTW